MLPIDRFLTAAARFPDAIAVGGETAFTFGELLRAVDAVAVAFQALDRAPRSRVGICAKNTVEHLIALLATYRAGKVWIPLNPRNGQAELDAMIATTAPGILVADRSCLDRFSPTTAALVIGKSDAAESGHSIRAMMRDFAGSTPATVSRRETDAHVLKFSGGSTGAPKTVIQSVRCINAQADGLRDFFAFDASDVNLIAAPLTHGVSCFVLPILEVGGRHVLLEHPTPAAILDAIERHGVTTLYAPPTMLYGMLDAVRPGHTFPTLRHVIYSAAPMTPERIRDCQRVFGNVIETAYGQVEAPQIITGMRADELLRDENLASVGRASRVATIRIDDGHGGAAGPGDAGEILVAGPLLMNGYLDQPELTARALRDGWLHTGDTGTIDERGYLYIRGRITESINTGGFKVFPGDVEAVLARHPAVGECAVFGVPDAKWGEAVTAAVVRVNGADVDESTLIDFVKQSLGSVKAPKSVRFVDALPRNAAGKVSRRDVRALVLAP